MRVLLFALFFTVVPLQFAFAQLPFAPQGFGASLASVSITTSPEYPRPNQAIEATVTSVSEDLRAATVVWVLNGEVIQESEGNQAVVFTTGDVGVVQTLQALVKTPNGLVLQDTITINPADALVVWEAVTYTPPLYRGRPLYSADAIIAAEAFVIAQDDTGNAIDPNTLIYTWSRNGSVLNDLSGRGAKSIRTQGPKFLGQDLISVEVSRESGQLIANTGALIDTIDPEVVLYEKDPLIGTRYHSAVTSADNLSNATQLEAVPFFMSARFKNDSSLTYRWRVNGKTVSNDPAQPSILSLVASEANGFGIRVDLTVEHAYNLLQSVNDRWSFSFSGESGGSLFGL